MGDDFIKNQGTNFRHRAEKTHAAEFEAINLFSSAPGIELMLFRFNAPEATPEVGMHVIFADLPNREKVRVIHNTTVIGEVDEAGSAELRRIMAEFPAGSKYLPGVIVEPKDIAGYSKAKLESK